MIQREKTITQKNESYAYCAEIFGISSKNKTVIDYYQRSCESLKDSWFADQLSLCNFPTKNKGYLEFPIFCNFHYDQNARSWSDRGKIGIGIVTKDDIAYTLDIYQKELEKYSPSYMAKHDEFLDNFNNKNSKYLYFLILIITAIVTMLLLKIHLKIA